MICKSFCYMTLAWLFDLWLQYGWNMFCRYLALEDDEIIDLVGHRHFMPPRVVTVVTSKNIGS